MVEFEDRKGRRWIFKSASQYCIDLKNVIQGKTYKEIALDLGEEAGVRKAHEKSREVGNIGVGLAEVAQI